MRTAVLISGQMRTAAYCYDSIKKHLLDRIGEHDVYAHVAYGEDAKAVDLFHPKAAWIGPQPDLDEKNYIMRTGRQVFGVQRVLRMWWSLYESWRIMRDSRIDYEWVIRLRPDTQFLNDIESPDTWQIGATIPKHNNWWGYCDRFAILSPAAAAQYHSMWTNLDNYIAQGGIFHPETYLKWQLDVAGIPVHRTNIVFDTVRKHGPRVIPVYHPECGDVKP